MEASTADGTASASAPAFERVRPSPTAAAVARAAAIRARGGTVHDLSAGAPDYGTPPEAAEAALRAIERGDTAYTQVSGTPALREAVVEKLRRENGLEYSTDEVVVGVGAKGVIFSALFASLAAGDEVVVPAPHYTSYPEMVEMAGGRPVLLHCAHADGFLPDPEALEAAIGPRTRWLVLNSPCNPTGAVYEPPLLEAIAEVVRRHPHLWVLSDEIYEHIAFDGVEIRSFAAIAPDLAGRTLTVNGVSKTYGMTGWRIGYGAGPAELIRATAAVQSQVYTSPPSISQAAAVAALSLPRQAVRERTQTLAPRRDLIVERLRAIPGVDVVTPRGTFYSYPSVAALIGRSLPDGTRIESDVDFATLLLEREGVLVVSGDAFGASPYVRASFAADESTIVEGCSGLASFVESLS